MEKELSTIATEKEKFKINSTKGIELTAKNNSARYNCGGCDMKWFASSQGHLFHFIPCHSVPFIYIMVYVCTIYGFVSSQRRVIHADAQTQYPYDVYVLFGETQCVTFVFLCGRTFSEVVIASVILGVERNFFH